MTYPYDRRHVRTVRNGEVTIGGKRYIAFDWYSNAYREWDGSLDGHECVFALYGPYSQYAYLFGTLEYYNRTDPDWADPLRPNGPNGEIYWMFWSTPEGIHNELRREFHHQLQSAALRGEIYNPYEVQR